MSNGYWEDFSPEGLNIPAAAGAANERSFGDVMSDIAIGALEGLAKNGGRGALAGAILGGIRGNSDSQEKLQYENASLQNQLLQQRLRQNEQQWQWAQEDRKENAADRQAIRAERQERMGNVRTAGEIEKLRLSALRQQSWKIKREQYQKDFDNMVKPFRDSLNITGRTMFDNDPGKKAQAEMYSIMRAADDGDIGLVTEFIRESGSIPIMKDGKLSAIQDVNGKIIPYNRVNMDSIMQALNQRTMYGLKAAATVGRDAADMKQFSVKNIFASDEFKTAFADGNGGIDGGLAYAYYDDYVQKGIAQKRFTDADLIGHQLNICIKAALKDGTITEKEKQLLLPLFSAQLNDVNCELVLPQDGNARNAKIKFTQGPLAQTDGINIMSFGDDLAARDKIWNSMRMDLRDRIAKAQKAGTLDGVGAGGGETSAWSNEEKALYTAGQKTAQELGVKIPQIEGQNKEDTTLTFGVAYNQAEQVFVETGDFKEAQKKLASELEDVGWKESQIPDLFGDKAEKQQIEILEKRNRFLRNRLNDKREKGEYRSEMVTTAELPGATDVDRTIPVGVRVEDADVREYKRNIDRIAELRNKQFTRMKNKMQAAEYSKRYPEKAKELAKAAASRR